MRDGFAVVVQKDAVFPVLVCGPFGLAVDDVVYAFGVEDVATASVVDD